MFSLYIRNNNNEDISTPEDMRHAIRIATELGADIVKISFKWDLQTLKYIIKDALIPVIIAGGELCCDEIELVERAKWLMQSGIDGLSYGRNIFLSSSPSSMTHQLSKVVFE